MNHNNNNDKKYIINLNNFNEESNNSSTHDSNSDNIYKNKEKSKKFKHDIKEKKDIKNRREKKEKRKMKLNPRNINIKTDDNIIPIDTTNRKLFANINFKKYDSEVIRAKKIKD